MSIAVLLLAAGAGTRMKSEVPKVLHPVGGKPLISYPLDLCRRLRVTPIVLVIGKKNGAVRKGVSDLGPGRVTFAVQDSPLGTAHAVQMGLKALKNFNGDVLILCGDMPLLKKSTLENLIRTHREKNAVLTFVTAVLPDPFGYGRVLRTSRGEPCAIVEEKDADEDQRKIAEINTGVYLINGPFLKEKLKQIENKNIKREYYLTDLVGLAFHEQKTLATVTVADPADGLGVNTQEDLTCVSRWINRERVKLLMAEGVRFSGFENVVIDAGVRIGAGTLVEAPVSLRGKTVIGKHCLVEPGSMIKDSVLDDFVTIKASSYIEKSRIEKGATIGPFAHLRSKARIGPGAKVGNFVEVKKSKIGKGSKANHLSYIGDALIGKGVNVGAGTITCNYDGFNKYKTVLEDDVFVGSDTQFVAPVRIGRGAVIGAGSTITKNVKPRSLALTRPPQVEIKNWAKKQRKKKK
ncbi:MAG: bifunctional UDP-N-acetylglucosamine diphosphorylase/glucosamine-1-phosphate N-acetyltransferase GlmU [Deltaproteobacteria bacterium]|nr:bifunctional UDP-N-acetylglucosamine diphosphorylase/glucosamine-1-phosphate N-acetyltransferase GlmU [Deltaproteobacteria bacterium]